MSACPSPTGPSSPTGTDPTLGPEPAPVPGASARVERPWGWYETLAFPPVETVQSEAGGYALKRLWISPESRISLQRHQHRSEHWVVVAGHGLLECGDAQIEAHPGTSLFVPIGAIHRASAGREGLLIIEVQRGDELREDDIERVADDYGRVVS